MLLVNHPFDVVKLLVSVMATDMNNKDVNRYKQCMTL